MPQEYTLEELKRMGGKSQEYSYQELQNLNKPKEDGFLKGLAKDIIKPFAEVGVSAYNEAAQIGSTTKGLIQGQQRVPDQMVSRNLPFLGETKPAFTGQETTGTATKKILGYGSEIGSWFIGGGGAKSVVAKTLKGKVLSGAATGAATGAIAGTLGVGGREAQNDSPIGSIILSSLKGGLVGGAMGGVLGGALPVPKAIYNTVKNLPTIVKSKLTEVATELTRMTPTASKLEAKWGKNTPAFLVDENLVRHIDSDGKYLNTKKASEILNNKYSTENEAFNSILKDSGQYVSLENYRKLALSQVNDKLKARGTDYEKAIKYINEEVDALRRNYANTGIKMGEDLIIPVDKFNEIKSGQWARSSVNSRSQKGLESDIDFQLGHSAKELIENTVNDVEVQRLNQRLGDFASAKKVLENADGKLAPGGGKVSKWFARTIGAVVTPGGPIAKTVGAISAEKVVEALSKGNTKLWNAMYQKLVKTKEGIDILQTAEKILQERNLVRQTTKQLPAPSSIPLPAKTGSTIQKEIQSSGIVPNAPAPVPQPQVARPGQLMLPQNAGEGTFPIPLRGATTYEAQAPTRSLMPKLKPVRTLDVKKDNTTVGKTAIFPKTKILVDENSNYNRKSFDNYLDSIKSNKIPATHETDIQSIKNILKGKGYNDGEDIFASLGYREKQHFGVGEKSYRILFDIPKKEVVFDKTYQEKLGQKYAIGLDTMDHGKGNEQFTGFEGHVSTPFKKEWITDILNSKGNSVFDKTKSQLTDTLNKQQYKVTRTLTPLKTPERSLDVDTVASEVKDKIVFHKAVSNIPVERTSYVTKYTPEEYSKMKTFLSNEGKTGYAIKPDGDLVSVFNYGPKGTGAKVVREAIKNGATKLDAIDSKLIQFYEKLGFKEVKRVKWDDKYAPSGWDYTKGGRPDIVYMELK